MCKSIGVFIVALLNRSSFQRYHLIISKKRRTIAVKKRIIFSALFSYIIIGMLSMSYAATWDLKTDWSNDINPNDAWTYGYYDGANNVPLISSVRGGDYWSTPQDSWVVSTGSHLGWFQSNGTENFDHNWLQGDIITHSQTNPGYMYINWTSTEDTFLTIDGGVWSTRQIGRTNNFELYLNSIQLTYGVIGYGNGYTDNRDNPAKFYFSNIQISKGDVISLRIGSPSTGDYAGVNLKITTPDAASVPLPAPILLLGSGLIGLTGLRRKFKKL
jgi:hypothetical protein